MAFKHLSGALRKRVAAFATIGISLSAAQAQDDQPGAAVLAERAAAQAPAPSTTTPTESVEQEPTSEPPEVQGVDLAWLLTGIQIFSASQQVEPISEAPVPATVVTADMIRAIGARNLREVLTTYVPGMTQVEDANELNVAMRGVYASSQQKILILLNGHRLNSRAYSMANPDFSISLDNLKQIEVIRGPGSSVYGNVALTAVINLVTKDGKDVDGISARVGGGNFGQKTGNLMFGKRFGRRHDVMVWANFFEAKGEPRFVPADQSYSSVPADGIALLGGARNPTSYNIGLNYKLGDWTLLLNTRNGGIVEPFTSSGPSGELYSPSAYRTLLNIGPGLSSRSNHGEVIYAHDFGGGFDLEVRGYYDTNDIQGMLVTNPNTTSSIFLNWQEDSMGAIAQARYSYDIRKFGKGNFTFGLQVDQMRLLDSALPAQTGGEWTGFNDNSTVQVLQPGEETIYSVYAQLKQFIGERLIFNIGARYDEKNRWKGPNVRNISPRVAVIYNAADWIDLKASFASSFVDAPYWYRYNSLPSFRGAETLIPEKLSSVQFTPTLKFWDGQITNTLNFFYNDVYDFVFRNNRAVAPDPFYQNAGTLKTIGLEEEFALSQEFYRVSANLAWQHALESRDYGTRGSQIFNVPTFVANLVVDVNPFFSLFRYFGVNVNVRYVGPQLSPIDIVYASNGTTYFEPDNRVPGYVLMNAGLRFTRLYFPGLSLDATMYNVLGTRYQQGGATTHPIPQPGRWFLLNLAYKFDPLVGA
ncbi:MAG: TonB-dependent receptor plug domain-containing protein [Myxococcaceae bacterium]